MRERILQAGCYILAVGFGCEAALTGTRLRSQPLFWPDGVIMCLSVILGFLCLVGAIHFGREARERLKWRQPSPENTEEYE